jgi:CheY-like chemotaxis protein
LLSNYNNKPKLEKFSEIINQRCTDLLEIINDILDIAKIESGQLPVNKEDCDLGEMFAELTSFFIEHQKRNGKQHIEFRLLNQNKNSFNTIVTDRVKLKQVFINLISNAFKFTENGKIEGGCKFDEKSNLVFYVSDTGTGIPPDKYDMVFERFAQIRNSKNQAIGGTGLGLPIVKGLIGLLGGKIWLDSKVEDLNAGKTGGTTFYFSIPYGISKSANQVTQPISETHIYCFVDKTILIVEDDYFNAEFIKETLSKTGITILHTKYGEEAIRIAQSQLLDLVLMDIRLPDINGYEATRQIKLVKPDLHVIAQTAFASHDDKKKAFDAGCIDYISKPLKMNILLSMISKYLHENH